MANFDFLNAHKLPGVTFNGSDAVRDLKIATATIDHYLNICSDLDFARLYENSLKTLHDKARKKRTLLQSS